MAIAYRKTRLVTEARVVTVSEETQKSLELGVRVYHQVTCPYRQNPANKCVCICVDLANGGGTMLPEKHFTYLPSQNKISWADFEAYLEFPIKEGDLFRLHYES